MSCLKSIDDCTDCLYNIVDILVVMVVGIGDNTTSSILVWGEQLGFLLNEEYI